MLSCLDWNDCKSGETLPVKVDNFRLDGQIFYPSIKQFPMAFHFLDLMYLSTLSLRQYNMYLLFIPSSLCLILRKTAHPTDNVSQRFFIPIFLYLVLWKIGISWRQFEKWFWNGMWSIADIFSEGVSGEGKLRSMNKLPLFWTWSFSQNSR